MSRALIEVFTAKGKKLGGIEYSSPLGILPSGIRTGFTRWVKKNGLRSPDERLTLEAVDHDTGERATFRARGDDEGHLVIWRAD